jgi:hypothetical protein
MTVFFFLPLPRTPSSKSYQHIHRGFAYLGLVALRPLPCPFPVLLGRSAAQGRVGAQKGSSPL